MEDIYKNLLEVVDRKNILRDEPMKKHTSFKIGGNAEFFIRINSVEELKDVLQIASKNKINVTVVGNGTNLLVRDGGIKGFVIKLELKDFKIKKSLNNILVTVESGMSLSTLSNISIKEEIEGLEFLCGIPGTVGGAVRMNAGAHGKEMKDVVIKTRYMTFDGKIKTLNLEDHKFSYRNSIFSKLNVIILDTTFKLKRGQKENIENTIKEYLSFRKEHQPLEYPNAGSTFKRVDNYITAKLIDDCGLKGYRIGDAEVSQKHAGFIINRGNATADDVIKLTEFVKKEIKSKYNIDIELELIVLGDEK